MIGFVVGAAVRVTFCDGAKFDREVGHVFPDGSFSLVGAPRKRRWLPDSQAMLAKQIPNTHRYPDPVAFIELKQ